MAQRMGILLKWKLLLHEQQFNREKERIATGVIQGFKSVTQNRKECRIKYTFFMTQICTKNLPFD